MRCYRVALERWEGPRKPGPVSSHRTRGTGIMEVNIESG